jgi:hypothetical protein
LAQIFHRSTNALSRASLFGAAFFIAGVIALTSILYESPYVSRQGVAPDQPVQFSHEHHVRGLGIDCRYCHSSVEQSSFAGMPSTKTCMTCHSQLWTHAELLAPVREAFDSGQPIPWRRVHDLPDFVYFDHSIHVAKGVACATCHGPVERMPLMYQARSLRMSWCLDCHRHPEQGIGPREAVFFAGESMPPSSGRPDPDVLHARALPHVSTRVGAEETATQALLRRYQIPPVSKLMNCSTCHR